jgi:DNA polymerase I
MRDLTTRMQRLLKSHDEATNHSDSVDSLEPRTGATGVGVIDSTETLTDTTFNTTGATEVGVIDSTVTLTDDSLLAGSCDVVDAAAPRHHASFHKTLSNLSNCQTEHELALTTECQTLSNSEPLPLTWPTLAPTEEPAPETIFHENGQKASDADRPCPYEYVTDPTRAEEVVAQLALAPAVGVDTETILVNRHQKKKQDRVTDLYRDRIRLVQIASTSGAWVFDLRDVPINLLIPVFTSPGLKVFHNAQFDMAFIRRATGVMPAPVSCTMLMDQLLRARREDRHRLGDAAAHWIGWDVDKTEQLSDWSADQLSDEQLGYAALDAAVLIPLHERLMTEITTRTLKVVLDLELSLLPAVTEKWEKGIGFDWSAWCEVYSAREADLKAAAKALDAALPVYLTAEQIVDALTDATKNKVRSKKHQKALEERTPIPVTWGSGPQIGAILKAVEVDLPLTDIGNIRTAQKVLEGFREKHPLVPLVLDYLSVRTLVKSYGLNWERHINLVTGRIHASFRQCGAVTGRFTVSSPPLHGTPRKGGYRECFRPSPGYAFLIYDWSQIEVRIVAEVSGDEALIDIFRSGEDMYTAMATRLLGLTDRGPTSDERQQAKAVVLGLNYGQSAKGLVKYAKNTFQIDMTEKQAREFITRYFTLFPRLRAWQQEEEARLERQGIVETRTALGRLRTVTSGSHGGAESGQEVLNSPIQGGGADCLKLAMVLLYESREELPGGSVVLPVHDELVYEVPIDQVELGKKRLAWAMDKALRDAALKRVPTGVNPDKIVVSDRWIKI